MWAFIHQSGQRLRTIRIAEGTMISSVFRTTCGVWQERLGAGGGYLQLSLAVVQSVPHLSHWMDLHAARELL